MHQKIQVHSVIPQSGDSDTTVLSIRSKVDRVPSEYSEYSEAGESSQPENIIDLSTVKNSSKFLFN